MLHRRTLEKASKPGLRFQGWKALPIGSKIAVVILLTVVLMAILAPVIAPYNPSATLPVEGGRVVHIEGIGDQVIPDNSVPPSGKFLMGTDGSARDIFSRIVY